MPMNSPTNTPNRNEPVDRSASADAVLGWTVFGLLSAGAVGVFKALSMASGVDVLLCLLGSVTAFGAVYFICFGRP